MNDEELSVSSASSDGSSASSEGPYQHWKRPIDMRQQLRTTLLCLNRKLQEPGLTRAIGSYYKGLMISDVWDRIRYIIEQIKHARRLDQVANDLIQELNGYLMYYFDNTWIMSMTMENLAKCSWISPQVRASAVMGLFDTFLQATQAHIGNVLCFVQFLHGNFDDPDFDSQDTTGPFTDWNVRFFERIFESGAIELPLHMVENIEPYCHSLTNAHGPHMPRLVASTVRDVVFVPYVYLANNPTNRHSATFETRLMEASMRMNQKIAELDAENEDSDDE
ncbi:hypothetical protein MPSEU_000936100 [Mayamaea pseudoterrestris]|nr:hypothetical protein MPSEU_000936100 [Mayamaea pseudoterrestris]